jgi:lysophospholipase L1-like esterase
VVLLIGVNDLLARRPLGAITADYARILEELGPATLALSVLPLRPELLDDRRAGEEANRLRPELDARIAAVTRAVGARHEDLSAALADARGELDARYTQDGVHLNGEGYLRLGAALRPHLPSEPPPAPAPGK